MVLVVPIVAFQIEILLLHFFCVSREKLMQSSNRVGFCNTI